MDAHFRPLESSENRSTLPFLIKRSLYCWIIAISGFWYAKGVLFNDLLRNQRITLFRNDSQQHTTGLILDILFCCALLLGFFRPRLRLPALIITFCLPVLFFLMTVNAWFCYTAPIAFWIAVSFLFKEESSFLRFWNIVRYLAIAGILGYATLLIFSGDLMELLFFRDFIHPSYLYAVYGVFVAGFFTRKADWIFILILAAFSLIHAIGYQHPFWPKTLIFAPFINWTTLHRFLQLDKFRNDRFIQL